jgi:hypothetical protein
MELPLDVLLLVWFLLNSRAILWMVYFLKPRQNESARMSLH